MIRELQLKLIKQHSAQVIVEQLEPYVTERRRERIDHVISGRLNSIQLAIEQPSDVNNALAAVRTCEALGISTIHIIDPANTATSMYQITQGAFYWVDIIYHASLKAFLNTVKPSLHFAGGTPNANMNLQAVPVTQPLCIFIGNEQHGLSEAAQTACRYQYTIPMFGMSESLNLSVSAAISLYDTSTRKRELLGQPGDLDDLESLACRARFYLNSVDWRLATGIFKRSV